MAETGNFAVSKKIKVVISYMSAVSENKWEISGKTSYWGWNLKELWGYRHLLRSLVRRDFLLNYQQTVLGPIWILIQPIMTLVTYVIVFGKMVGIGTGSIPPVLFYFSGIVLWNFFNDSFTGTSFTFKENAHIFSKVYFPRIVMPLSVISTHFLRFLMQLVLLVLLMVYYWLFLDSGLLFSFGMFAVPVIIFLVGVIGLSLGLFFSVVTAKYRDLMNVVSLGVRLFMFVTPVIYPVSTVPENVRWMVELNPLTPLFELFRFTLLGEGHVTGYGLIYSVSFAALALLGSTLLFNKQGDKLIDIV
ncbi:ABC transporter permease [Pontibacter beigongshangensis]|uniref:ABC transporter permease n=1 Tax=Pontibacter beigongshangensis TaxID=2574733 RepID=UPI00164F87C9|nr:ABC transporter permease [Pontibacter beigongshangensis]